MSRHIETLLVQAGNRKDAGTGAVSLPIHLSTAYEHKGIGQSTGFDYSRTGNPTRSALEEILAQLEGDRKHMPSHPAWLRSTPFYRYFKAGTNWSFPKIFMGELQAV